jgi:hypothetical protein
MFSRGYISRQRAASARSCTWACASHDLLSARLARRCQAGRVSPRRSSGAHARALAIQPWQTVWERHRKCSVDGTPDLGMFAEILTARDAIDWYVGPDLLSW